MNPEPAAASLLGRIRMPQPFVRPRYDDGTFDDPLLVEDLLLDRVLVGDERRRLVVLGERGSGLTTTIAWARALVVASGRRALELDDLVPPSGAPTPAEVVGLLADGQGVLLLDLSVSGGARDGRTAGLFARDLPGWPGTSELVTGGRAVVAGHARFTGAGRGRQRWQAAADGVLGASGLHGVDRDAVRLAPWGPDDLVELLGAPGWRERRARLLAGLAGCAGLLGRPRAARWLVDAAAGLAEGEEATLGRLYANVLDRLAPDALEVLRHLRGGGPEVALEALTRAIHTARGATDTAALPADELPLLLPSAAVVDLFELADEVVARLAPASEPVLLGRTSLANPRRGPLAGLVLPGLADLLQAGEALAGLTRGVCPPAAPRGWRPFLAELWTEGHTATLGRWLAGDDPARHAPAASLLWARGLTPPLDGGLHAGADPPRRLSLEEADLEGLQAPGVDLSRAALLSTRLAGARLPGARLVDASLIRADLDGADLAGADLSQVHALEVGLRRATLREACLEEAVLLRCDLSGADLTDARLDGARLGGTRLAGAWLAGARLVGASVTFEEPAPSAAIALRHAAEWRSLAGLDLSGADLTRARLVGLDLRRAVVRPATLRQATLRDCHLGELELDGLLAENLELEGVDLTGTSLREARLGGAKLRGCRAHGLVLDGADLRLTAWSRVSFHVGSTRSGLLVGAPALEGSMTGLYAAEAAVDERLAPDDACAASLRGCDLRWARFEGTSLFKVDLRGARLDPPLREQARRDGALLD